jgi:hypothetical protein
MLLFILLLVLLQLENYRVISNVKQRDFKGGKPAIIINEEKYHIKALCPEPITVPIGVEAVWALITHKKKNLYCSKFNIL